MKLATIDDDSDSVMDADRVHSNGEDCGYCCPHCTAENSHRSTGERTAVICDHCGETFVIWNETEIRQCSGKLAA